MVEAEEMGAVSRTLALLLVEMLKAYEVLLDRVECMVM